MHYISPKLLVLTIPFIYFSLAFIVDQLAKKKNKKCVRALWFIIIYRSLWDRSKEAYDIVERIKKEKGIPSKEWYPPANAKSFWICFTKPFTDKTRKVSVASLVFQIIYAFLFSLYYIFVFIIHPYVIKTTPPLLYNLITFFYALLIVITFSVLLFMSPFILENKDYISARYNPRDDPDRHDEDVD